MLFIVFRSGKHPLHVKAMSRMKERAKNRDIVSDPCGWVGGLTARYCQSCVGVGRGTI